MPEWPKSRLIAAQYQSPFYDGIGFAKYASTGAVTEDLWKNIERIESDAKANPGAPEVEGWAEDMVALRAALNEEGIHETIEVTFRWSNSHGICDDCGELPANYYLPDYTTTHMDDPANPVVAKGAKMCPICAALHASYGESRLERLWKDDDDDADQDHP